MFDHLDVADAWERRAVAAADAALTVACAPMRWRRRTPAGAPGRILLLRLERIGDLLMSMGALAEVRRLAPSARIDLVVGSWNRPIAELLPGIDRVETMDASWLARGAGGLSMRGLVSRGRRWREHGYDLAINFEGDIRSHLLMALSGAGRRVGFDMAGGGPTLTDRVAHDPGRHVADNALALVERAFGLDAGTLPPPLADATDDRWRLRLPEAARERAAAHVSARSEGRVGRATRLLAVHPSGGRAIKQWDADRFAAVASRVARTHGLAVVVTGTADDQPLVGRVVEAIDADVPVVPLAGGIDLPDLAAVLERSALIVTGDTGPMHLAAAVGTPVVAVFGPSYPWRYAPLVRPSRIVRVDIECSPCNRIRRPPARCVGHTPDCLAGVTVDAVCAAADEVLAATEGQRA